MGVGTGRPEAMSSLTRVCLARDSKGWSDNVRLLQNRVPQAVGVCNRSSDQDVGLKGGSNWPVSEVWRQYARPTLLMDGSFVGRNAMVSGQLDGQITLMT